MGEAINSFVFLDIQTRRDFSFACTVLGLPCLCEYNIIDFLCASNTMVSPALLHTSVRQEISICARCSFRASEGGSRTSRRWIGQKYLAKKDEAERKWQEQAKEIKAGKKKSMLSLLEERGLVHQIAGYNFLCVIKRKLSV